MDQAIAIEVKPLVSLDSLPPDERRKLAVDSANKLFSWIKDNEESLSPIIFWPNNLSTVALPLLVKSVSQEYFDDFHSSITQLAELDLQTTQGICLDHTQDPQTPLVKFLAGISFSNPDMATPDGKINLDQEPWFPYFDRIVKLQMPAESLKNAKVRELLAGQAVLLENEQGLPISILHLNLLQATPDPNTNQVTTTAITYDAESFHRNFSYGQPVTLEEIKAYLDDSQFPAEISKLLNKDKDPNRALNPAVLPLYARVRLHKMLSNPELDQSVKQRITTLFHEFEINALGIFQLLKEEELIPALEMFDYLSKKGMTNMANLLLRGSLLVGEFAIGLAGGMDQKSLEIARLLEIKTKQQLLEAVKIYQKNKSNPDKITAYDWEMMAYSMEMLASTAQAALSLQRNEEFLFPFEKANMPPHFLVDVYDFSSRHPEAATISQTLFDFATSIFISHQDDAFYHGQIPLMKSEFYRQFTEMYKNSPTTDNRDVDRTHSLILDYLNANPELKEKGTSLLLGGCGTCERFEGPLIRKLTASGVKMVRRIGVDINDHSDQIPDDLAIQFKQADLSDEKFALDEPVDILVLPWSMINDFVEKRNLLEALQVFKKLVKNDGLIIFDVPLPIGQNSYAATLENQADHWGIWGLMERDFEQGSDRVSSIFDIMHIRELIFHLLNAGLMPNLPLEFDKLQALCKEVEADDSPLTERHESGEDTDAVQYPLWQAKGYNRATIAARNTDPSEIFHLTGLSPSILTRRTFSKPREG